MYLLDADICIYHLRGPRPELAGRLAAQSAELAISSITIAELQYGVFASTRPEENQRLLQEFLAGLEHVSFDAASPSVHASIRLELRRAGTPIGPMDLLVAAIALAHDATLITNNVREFSRVPGLHIENWLNPA